jgi:hypothetical protein
MSCAAKSSSPVRSYSSYADHAEAEVVGFFGGLGGSVDAANVMARGGGVRSAPPPQAMMESAEWMDGSSANEPATPARGRMINYNGDIHLQNAEPEAVIDTVVEQLKAKGGSVSNRRNGFVSLQIPVAEFKAFFDYILTLGNVARKSISASDITDAYSDNAARLRIAENTLARYRELLALAKTEKEKIALLKEIQRISEEIEQRKIQEKELLRQAAFSTITLRVSNIPAKPLPQRINIRAFEWLAMLPNENLNFNRHKALKLEVPKNFIETENSKNRWNVASALNAKFWAFEKQNKPQGTPDFWANAMLYFFKFSFATELKTEENFSLVRLQTSHSDPQIYYIAILKSTNEKTLRIAQAYFPTKEAEEKNSEAVLETLRRAK